jgi:RsiW-degrading membrane proteinase PrsW (M82 family)
MIIFVLTGAAVAPALLLVWFFHGSDRFPEPPRILWGTFFWGVFSILPALILAAPGSLIADRLGNPFASAFVSSFFGAAIPEEIAKLGVLLYYSLRKPEFDEPMDGLVYGAVASLGFAAFENVLYVASGGLGLAVLRALTAVPMHAAFGAIMGAYVGRARFDPARKNQLIGTGLTLAILLHGLYDFPVLSLKNLGENKELAAASPDSVKTVLGIAMVAVLAVTVTSMLRVLRRQQVLQWAAVPPLPSELTAKARRLKVSGILGAVIGGLLTASGGIFFLAAVLALLFGGPKEKEEAVEIGVFVGLLPGAIGAFAFAHGLKKLNERRRLVQNSFSRATTAAMS